MHGILDVVLIHIDIGPGLEQRQILFVPCANTFSRIAVVGRIGFQQGVVRRAAGQRYARNRNAVEISHAFGQGT